MKRAIYHVYFALRYPEEPISIEKPAIIVIPSTGDLRDHGFGTRFAYVVLEPEHRSPSNPVAIHLAFAETDQPTETPLLPRERQRADAPAQVVSTKVQQSQSKVIASNQFPTFYTMHLSLGDYRELVQRKGPDDAEGLLLAINDLVAVRRAPRLPPWFVAATSSEEFKHSFMRNAETFFAFHNAGSVLGGLEQESLRGISNKLRLEFHLQAFRNPHVLQFSFEYESDLPKRIAILIGKNGTGKSQALAHFAKSLLARDSRLTDGNRQPPLINRLLAVSSPGETRNTFPRPRKKGRIYYHRIFLQQNIFGVKHPGLGEALVRLVRSGEMIREKGRWDLFCDAVSAIAPLEQLGVQFRRPNADRARAPATANDCLALARMREGGDRERLERWGNVSPHADVYRIVNGDVLPLSSGQLTFIRFAAQACLHIENGTILLFDEPETHMHPHYISGLVLLLDNLLRDTGSFAILATHSPYLVREVPRSQVIVLREPTPGTIEVSPTRLKTLGADIGAISAFVFEEGPYGHLLSELQKVLQSEGAGALSRLQSLEEELPAEAIMHLRRTLQGQGRE